MFNFGARSDIPVWIGQTAWLSFTERCERHENRLKFMPQEDGCYTFEGVGTLQPLLGGIVRKLASNGDGVDPLEIAESRANRSMPAAPSARHRRQGAIQTSAYGGQLGDLNRYRCMAYPRCQTCKLA
jgi:hypothetical protein